MTSQLDADLDLAQRMADAADAISLGRFLADDLKIESKPDLTPVSDADLAVERAIRALLDAERPDDAVIGEEFGADRSSSSDSAVAAQSGPGQPERRWVIDPIDGTKNYVRGVPIWATLIALFEGEQVVVGVVSAPALSRRWWAAQGTGSWVRFAGGAPRRLAVSAVRELGDASVTYSEPAEWSTAGRRPQFDRLLDGAWRTRGYGDFYSYMLVAEGAAEVATEPELSLWDVAALVPVVTEAGGSITDIDGGPIGPGSTSALATNGVLHPAVTALLAV